MHIEYLVIWRAIWMIRCAKYWLYFILPSSFAYSWFSHAQTTRVMSKRAMLLISKYDLQSQKESEPVLFLSMQINRGCGSYIADKLVLLRELAAPRQCCVTGRQILQLDPFTSPFQQPTSIYHIKSALSPLKRRTERVCCLTSPISTSARYVRLA